MNYHMDASWKSKEEIRREWERFEPQPGDEYQFKFGIAVLVRVVRRRALNTYYTHFGSSRVLHMNTCDFVATTKFLRPAKP